MAEHKEGHDHRHADAAKHSTNGADGGAMHPKGVHGDINEDIRGIFDENTLIDRSCAVIYSKDSETSEVISELKKLGELKALDNLPPDQVGMAKGKIASKLKQFLEEQEKLDEKERRNSTIPYALIALGKTEDKSMSTRIIIWMHDKHPEVRASVADAVSYLRNTECSEAMSSMLKDHDDRVRLAAVKSLGSIGDVNVILPICALAADPSSEVRAESAKSVVAIIKRNLSYDIPSEKLQGLLLLAKTVKDSFIKIEKSEKISLVRDSFDSCINDITTILLSHEAKNAKNAVETAQREIERLTKENQQIRAETKQKLDNADDKMGDLADENHQLRVEIKDLRKKLEESMQAKGELTNKFIDLKARVEKSEKLITEAEELKQEVESLRGQLISEESMRKAFGNTERDLQGQIRTYKREVEAAGKRDELYKEQVEDMRSKLRATMDKARDEIGKSWKELAEAERIKKEKQDIESQIADLKKSLEEKEGKIKDAEEKSRQLEALEARLKESDEKIKILEDRVKTKENGSLDSIMNTLDNIESKQKLPKKKKIGYKIGIGFLTAVVLIEAGLLVRSTFIIKDQNAKMAKINDTRVEAANSRAQNATQKLTKTEAAYKEISSMDFVIGKFFTDPEAIISMHYKSKNKAEARQILDECRDEYWEISDSIKDIGPEKACEEMCKYYLLVDMVGSGKLKEAKGEYKKVFGKEFKLILF